MVLSRQSREILLDLIEIKVSSLEVQDLDDRRVLTSLQKCRQELLAESQKEEGRSTRKSQETQVLYG